MISLPLEKVHENLGARMAPFAGFRMPIQYKGILVEHAAARSACALFDTSHMGELEVRGATALADLEKLVSRNLASLKPNRCRYGLLCNPDGGVLDDLLVYRTGPEEFMLVVNGACRDKDAKWISEHLSGSTRFRDVSENLCKIDVQGPDAPRVTRTLVDDDIAELRFYHFMHTTYRGRKVLVSRTGYTGEIGYEIYCDAETAERFWG